MSMAATSLISYRQLSPKALGKKQSTVLSFLLHRGPMTNKELSEEIGWPINTITPRVKELRDLGLVQLDSIKYDNHTNRSEAVWRVVDVQEVNQ